MLQTKTRWSLEGIAKDTVYWNNSSAIQNRLEALREAKADLVLFCECFPMTIETWLRNKIEGDDRGISRAIELADKSIDSICSVLAQQKMIHFDVHFRNILTDGRSFFLSDFGLTLSSYFDLSKEELDFFERHKNYDRAMLALSFMHGIFITLFGTDHWVQRLKEYMNGDYKILPNFIHDIANKYGATALAMNEFFDALRKKSKLTPFPNDSLHIDAVL